MNSLDRWFFRNVYRTAVLMRGESGVFRELAQLKELDRSEPPAVQELQGRRLHDILAYARERCTLYKQRLPGAPPTALPELLTYLHSVPPLEKADLRSHREGLTAKPGPRRLTVKTTGGSTGEAVTVVKDRASIAREMAVSWLGYGWFGVRIGDRAVRFWGSPRNRSRKARFVAADLAMHRIRFSSFGFDEESLMRYWARCRRFEPDYLYGYVSMITEFARFLGERQIDARELRLKVVVTTSEVLNDTERRLLQETFDCPVQNEYGCGEMGAIAYSCPDERLHIMSPNIHLEVIDPNGRPVDPGESGEVVVTDLGNRAMPLIRYRVGDRATLGAGECTCGRPFPTLERIWGRAYDFVRIPDGRRFHGEFFMYLFEELRDRGLQYDRFQVRQPASDRLEIRILARELDPRLEQLLRSRLDDALPGVSIEVRHVQELPRTPSGKTRVVVSEVEG